MAVKSYICVPEHWLQHYGPSFASIVHLTYTKTPGERSEPAKILPLRHVFAICEVLGGGSGPPSSKSQLLGGGKSMSSVAPPPPGSDVRPPLPCNAMSISRRDAGPEHDMVMEHDHEPRAYVPCEISQKSV